MRETGRVASLSHLLSVATRTWRAGVRKTMPLDSVRAILHRSPPRAESTSRVRRGSQRGSQLGKLRGKLSGTGQATWNDRLDSPNW